VIRHYVHKLGLREAPRECILRGLAQKIKFQEWL